MFFLAGALAGGNVIAMALRMVGGVLTARVIEPSALGLFNGIGLALAYAPFLQLGILNGLNRELPYCVGMGDHHRSHELAAAAQAWAIAVGSAVAGALLLVAGWFAMRGDWPMAAGWGVTAFSGWLLFYGTFYLEVTYRTGGDFARLALVNVLNGTTALALLVLVWLLKYYGLCLRALAVGIVQLALLWYWRPLPVKARWNTRHMLHLFKIGAPLMGVGQLFAWWGALDSTLVLHFEGVKGLGLYALALMAGSSLNLLPEAVTQVVYPRMAEGHGRGEGLNQLLRRAARPALLLLAGVIPLAALGWIVAPPLVAWIAPKYVEVIPAARWALLVPVVACLSPVLQVFNVVKRQVPYAMAMAVGMGAYVVSLLLLRHFGASLKCFPQAMAIGRLVFVAVCLTILLQLAGRERPAAQER